jgi:PucR C-terminal helix-turn-helix domain
VAAEERAVTGSATEPQVRDWLCRTARRLLTERLDELVSLAISRLHSDEPQYARSPVSQDDLKRSMRRTLALALTRVAGDPIPDELLTSASEVGRRRAEQGLPLPALLHSYRIDLRVLWEAIHQEGRLAGIASDEAFLDAWILVWEAIEANIAEVVDAYRQAMEDMSRSLDVLRGRAFKKLVETGEHDPSAVREGSRRLGMPMEARYLVVVGDEIPVDHALVVGVVARLKARGLSSYLDWIGDELVGVVRLAARRPDDVISHLSMLSDWKCGVVVVEGLASVPRGVRLARVVIASLTRPGLRLLEADWPAVLVNSNEELASALSEQVLGPLLALPEHDRAAVFETLEAYIHGSGSVTEVASQTLRHRNTVRNRLQTVERITGLSLSKPRDVAAITLAMASRYGPDDKASRR